jgi:predicted DNA-binding protein
MITKRIIVQKGFRLPEAMVNDLEKISSMTGRSQNELVEFAIGDFIKENIIYLIEHEMIMQISNEFLNDFYRVFGDLLITYRFVDDENSESYNKMDVYQLDEKMLSQLDFRLYKTTDIEENENLKNYKVNNIVCLDVKLVTTLLHESLLNYDFDTPLMKKWIDSNYSY